MESQTHIQLKSSVRTPPAPFNVLQYTNRSDGITKHLQFSFGRENLLVEMEPQNISSSLLEE